MFKFGKKNKQNVQATRDEDRPQVAPVVRIGDRGLLLYAAIDDNKVQNASVLTKDLYDIRNAKLEYGIAYPVSKCCVENSSAGFSISGLDGFWFNTVNFVFYVLDGNELKSFDIYNEPELYTGTVYF